MSINPHYRTVKQLLQSRSFSIDEYQREYKWESKHVEELLSDLLGKFSAFYSEGDTPQATSDYGEYFLGSIIVTNRGGKTYLVDGQQRVTTLTLLIIYLYRTAQALHLPVAATLSPLIFSDDRGVAKFNLDIEERLPVIQALFEGTDINPDGQPESNQTLIARYQDIENANLAEDLGDGLSPFIYWLMDNVGLIEIATGNDAHAFAIFETMNDRGKPLSPIDMAKAYLLSPIANKNNRATANREWKATVLKLTSWGEEADADRDAAMMKAWLRAQHAESIRERKAGAVDRDWELIGTTFHRWMRDHANRLAIGTERANLSFITEQFPFFARAYLHIREAELHYTPGLEALFYNAHNDFTWQPTVLLASLDPADDDETVKTKLALAGTYLDIWMMRRVVNYIRVGYSSVNYAMYLLVRDIRRKSVPELRQVLLTKLADDDVSFREAPHRGREGITDLRINQFSRRYILHILARLTAFVDEQSGQPGRFDILVDRSRKNAYDIEHIVPNDFSAFGEYFPSASEFERWRDNIGGLILLPADVNRSLQAKPYEKKLLSYARENLLAASLTPGAYQHQPQFYQFRERSRLNFSPYAQFGLDEQQHRRELIAKLAELVWSPNRLNEIGANSR